MSATDLSLEHAYKTLWASRRAVSHERRIYVSYVREDASCRRQLRECVDTLRMNGYLVDCDYADTGETPYLEITKRIARCSLFVAFISEKYHDFCERGELRNQVEFEANDAKHAQSEGRLELISVCLERRRSWAISMAWIHYGSEKYKKWLWEQQRWGGEQLEESEIQRLTALTEKSRDAEGESLKQIVSQLKESIRSHQRVFALYESLIEALVKLGDLEQALRFAQIAEEVATNVSDTRVVYGQIARIAFRYEANTYAIEYAGRILGMRNRVLGVAYQDYAQKMSHYIVGILHMEGNRVVAARNHLNIAWKKYDILPAGYALASMLSGLGNSELTESYTRDLVRRYPHDKTSLELHIHALAACRKFDDAETALTTYMKHHFDDDAVLELTKVVKGGAFFADHTQSNTLETTSEQQLMLISPEWDACDNCSSVFPSEALTCGQCGAFIFTPLRNGLECSICSSSSFMLGRNMTEPEVRQCTICKDGELAPCETPSFRIEF